MKFVLKSRTDTLYANRNCLVVTKMSKCLANCHKSMHFPSWNDAIVGIISSKKI